jgi:hypothetical protein
MSSKEKVRCPADYFPDLEQWPNDWIETKKDLKIGRGLLALFILFIQHLIDEGLAKKTKPWSSRGSHVDAPNAAIQASTLVHYSSSLSAR